MTGAADAGVRAPGQVPKFHRFVGVSWSEA